MTIARLLLLLLTSESLIATLKLLCIVSGILFLAIPFTNKTISCPEVFVITSFPSESCSEVTFTLDTGFVLAHPTINAATTRAESIPNNFFMIFLL